MLLIVFSQLGFDGFVEELDVVLDAEIVEEVFRSWQILRSRWPDFPEKRSEPLLMELPISS
jgi:hypothetical protein